jgi:hypothetical protein
MSIRPLWSYASVFLLCGAVSLAGCDPAQSSRDAAEQAADDAFDPEEEGTPPPDSVPGHVDDEEPPGDEPPEEDDDLPPADLTPVSSSEIERPIVLTMQALLPETLADFQRVEVGEGLLTLEFAADGGDAVQIGSVLAGHLDGGYLQRVTAIERRQGGTVVVHTVPAALTELIAEGHFRLRASASAPRVEKALIPLPAGLPCTLEATGQVVEITPSYTFDPALELELDIGLNDELVPVLNYARAVVSGDLTMSVKVAGTGKLHGKCSVDLLAGLNPVSWTTNFALGLLPVTIRHHIGPSLVASLELLLEGGLSSTASVTVSLSAGVEYTCGRFQPVTWASDVTGDLDVVPTARGSLTATLTPALGYDIELLGFTSASLGIRADLVGRVAADAVSCAWDASLDASVTAYAHAHLSVPVLGTPLVDIDEERTLWSSTLASDEGVLPFCPIAAPPHRELAGVSY